MKKLISLLGAGVLLAAVVVPALAHHHKPVVNRINNSTTAVASSGVVVGNVGPGCVRGDNYVNATTGDADALAVGVVVKDVSVGCGCNTCPCSGSRDHSGSVINNVTGAQADSSVYVGNSGPGFVRGNNYVNATTGDASATAVGVVVKDVQLNWGD